RGRLLDDAETGRDRAVRAEHPLRLAGSDLHGRDLAEADEMAVLALEQHELAEVLRGLVIAGDADLEIEVARFDPSGGKLEILGTQRVLDVDDGEVPCRERVPIEPDPHRRAAGAEDVDLR